MHNLKFTNVEDIDYYGLSTLIEEFELISNENTLLNIDYKNKFLINESIFSFDRWQIFNKQQQLYYQVNFEKVKELIEFEELIVLKCWVLSLIKEDYSASFIRVMYDSVASAIKASNNFDINFINGKKGNAIFTIMQEQEGNKGLIPGIISYIDFLEEYDFIEKGHHEAIKIIKNNKKSLFNRIKRRELPSNKDILTFAYYIKKFFEETKDDNLKNFFKPLLLWWKITNVIPMRPSEFSFKLKPDCLIKENGELYLKVSRIKLRSNRKKVGRIPILNKLTITKEIYDLIDEYRELVSFDKNRDTLISYKALINFKNEVIDNDSEYLKVFKKQNFLKRHSESFNSRLLSDLIVYFYKIVIEGIYGFTSYKDRICAGDTRHLAFTSLFIQGLTPIEIAMIGGHTTLNMQINYTGHIEFYIGSEMLNFVSNNNLNTRYSQNSVKKIVFNKSFKCPKLSIDCDIANDDGIGLCTLDLNSNEDIETCSKSDICIFCDLWWCEPTNENYLKVRNYLENNVLSPLEMELELEEQVLVDLIRKSYKVNNFGLLDLEREWSKDIEKARKKLVNTADKIIWLKNSMSDLVNCDYNKLE